jgi:hypothetical protein
MEAGERPRFSMLQCLMAGLETGVLAVLLMLAWLGASSIWYRRSFWTTPNLLAAAFYGQTALHNRFTVHTFFGLGLYIVIYGSIGMLFALAIQNRPAGLRITCAGILCGIVWYLVAFGWIWKRLDPLLLVYTHDRPMFAGHVLYGWILGRRYPRNLPRMGTHRAVVELPLAPLAGSGPASSDLEIKD